MVALTIFAFFLFLLLFTSWLEVFVLNIIQDAVSSHVVSDK